MTCKACGIQLTPESKVRGRASCKPCEVDRVRAWRAANPTKKRALDARDRVSRKAQRALYDAQWRAANPERVKAWHKRCKAGRMALIRQENKNYRARRKGAVGAHSLRDVQRLFRRFGGSCFYCRTASATTVDHVIPLSRGGSNSIGNIVPACLSCNSRKNARTVMEWRCASG